MRRQAITKGRMGWFRIDEARSFQEVTVLQNNRIVSLATGSPYHHETLYQTSKGAWVLHRYSDLPSCQDVWEEVTENEAAMWLIQNRYNPDDVGLGEVVQALEI